MNGERELRPRGTINSHEMIEKQRCRCLASLPIYGGDPGALHDVSGG